MPLSIQPSMQHAPKPVLHCREVVSKNAGVGWHAWERYRPAGTSRAGDDFAPILLRQRYSLRRKRPPTWLIVSFPCMSLVGAGICCKQDLYSPGKQTDAAGLTSKRMAVQIAVRARVSPAASVCFLGELRDPVQ